MTITVERIIPSGYWLLSTIYQGYRVHRRYGGYSKREAIAQFKYELTHRGMK